MRATRLSPAYSSALGQASADKRVEILRRVARSGSISQAARDAGVSYKAAWQAIDTLTNLAGVTLVERAVGGAGGGGARITVAGVQLLAAADALTRARSQVLSRLQATQDLGPGAAGAMLSPALGQLSVRTSMRNQLPCTVHSVQAHGQIVEVGLQLAGGHTLVARITRESVELLGLREREAVLALCKATAVAVQRASAGRAPAAAGAGRPRPAQWTAAGLAPACNLLPGKATRVTRGENGDEVAARLDAGMQLVGFAPPASGLRSGSRVLMSVEPSAVVIAASG